MVPGKRELIFGVAFLFGMFYEKFLKFMGFYRVLGSLGGFGNGRRL